MAAFVWCFVAIPDGNTYVHFSSEQASRSSLSIAFLVKGDLHNGQ